MESTADSPQLSIKLEGPKATSGNNDDDVNDQDRLQGEETSVFGLNGGENKRRESNNNQPNIQEGNDIYMTCQMDANPRPVKPILWRFNGRPMQPQQSAANANGVVSAAVDSTLDSTSSKASGSIFVITNQSLVLRKVTRHQSGSYTCEAANQHGTNVSKALELDIKHAPVCLTNHM